MPFLLIFKVIGGWFTSVFSFFAKNPIYLVILGAFVAGIFSARYLGETKSAKQLHELQAVVKKQQDRINEVEKESVIAATLNKEREESLKTDLKNAQAEYEEKLVEAVSNQKVKIIKVQVPGVSKPTDIYVEGNEVACRRLPSSYKDQVNELVTKGERSVK